MDITDTVIFNGYAAWSMKETRLVEFTPIYFTLLHYMSPSPLVRDDRRGVISTLSSNALSVICCM